MEIKLNFYLVMNALQKYLEDQYSLKTNLDPYSENCSIADEIFIEYMELEKVYKKYRNGRIVKDKYGFPIIDREKAKYKTKYLSLDESAAITFHINNKEGW